MPLSVFIDILCEGKYELMGSLDVYENKAAFDDILEQYNTMIGGTEYTGRLKKMVKLLILESKINRGFALVQALLTTGEESLFKAMYQHGYLLPNYTYSEENIILIVQAFEGHLKKDSFDLDLAVKEFESVDKSDTKPNREAFIDMILALTEYYKVTINEAETSVEKYCMMVSRYQKEIERINQKNSIKK